MDALTTRDRPAIETQKLSSFDPNTGDLIGTVPIADEADVRTAVVRAREAQREWAARPLPERIDVLRGAQEVFVDRAHDIVDLSVKETGKSPTMALTGDVVFTLANLSKYLKMAPRALEPRKIRHGLLHATKSTVVVWEPAGVVAVLSAFNYPMILTGQSAFAALIAGNAVVNKPSEKTPLLAVLMKEILVEGGLPPDLFQITQGGAETGRALVDAGVDRVALVGSARTGSIVAEAAGRNLIPVIMELGGQNAMIVLDDARLDRAAACAISYAFGGNGEICGSVSRVYVQDAVADEFLDRLQTGLSELRVTSDVTPGACDVTALIDEAALDKVTRHVEDAVSGGGRVLAGGARLSGTEAPVFEPTLLVDVDHEAAMIGEETFGPVLSVTRIKDEDEAVLLANDSDYGLTASVFTTDKARAWDVAGRLEVGTVAINDHFWPCLAPEVPWGGMKQSGIGRVGGEWGLQAMTEPKVISDDRLNLPREFYWAPHTRRTHEVLRQLPPLLFSRRLDRRLKAVGDLVRVLTGS